MQDAWFSFLKMEQTIVDFYSENMKRFSVKVNWDYNGKWISFATLQTKKKLGNTETWSINDPDCPIDIYTMIDDENKIMTLEDLLFEYNDVKIHFYIDEAGEKATSFQLSSVEIHDNDCVFMFNWEVA